MPKVTRFKAYPFEVGEKIRIDSGPRFGDWEVITVTDRKVTLKCPVSGRERAWSRFCYHVEEKEMQWPQND